MSESLSAADIKKNPTIELGTFKKKIGASLREKDRQKTNLTFEQTLS